MRDEWSLGGWPWIMEEISGRDICKALNHVSKGIAGNVTVEVSEAK